MVSECTAVEFAAVASRDRNLFSLAQAVIAGHAYRRCGRGRHPAGLNFGDVFAYAFARETDLPLLFKGMDFSCADIKAAQAR